MLKFLVAGPVAVALLFGSCSTSKLDASQPSTSNVDRAAPKVIAFSDDFPNVATKCAGFGHHRLWVTSHVNTDTPPVITTDETCP